MLNQGDWILKIDQESAFHHIIVDKDFRPYLDFTLQNRYYQYRAMRFGVKHAPLTFHKTLRPVIRIIREELGVRHLAYCDDIIVIHEDRGKLLEAKGRIINMLMNFGWKICNEQINFGANQSTNISEVVNRLEQRSINNGRCRISKDEGIDRKMEKNSVIMQDCEASWKGWNIKLHLHHNILLEIIWGKSQIDKNKPIQATIAQSEAILATDASLRSQGACLKLTNPIEDIWIKGNWSNRWNFNSSNQLEEASILCALLRQEPYFKMKKIKSLNIETDNNSSTFNINKRAAAVALANQVDRTLEIVENYNLQLHAYLIPRTQNMIPDSLSRLSTSENYMINQQILNEALHILKVKPSIDLFQNRKNRRFKRFISAEQIRERKDNCSDGSFKLAIPIMVVEPHEVDLEMVNSGKKRRRVNHRWEDEEIKKTPSSKINDSVNISGNKHEKLFRQKLEQRELAAAAMEKVNAGQNTI
ncbi:MAG: hypothetical protein EZS28_014530 [Streblomastix strix]|uniref:Reverse transcriptase domain-containing protein n=1 Tax=Streblomastix strix TaxID=222440 RepID=A0A5J4W4T6_9EUKA|nr:MAG: hypothetical protein EZS28_014530 [Streblomastix strix]